jgi:hypothetical protein
MRLGFCRASLTRPEAPTSEKSDLLKLRLSHRENGFGNRVWSQIPIGVGALLVQSASKS